MRPLLPRPFGRKSPALAILVALGCRHDLPRTAPPDPIAAEQQGALNSADDECGRFLAALDRYGECRHASDGERSWARRVAEVFTPSFQAARRSKPDAEADRAMASACHRAAQSVTDATARCDAGLRPAPAYE